MHISRKPSLKSLPADCLLIQFTAENSLSLSLSFFFSVSKHQPLLNRPLPASDLFASSAYVQGLCTTVDKPKIQSSAQFWFNIGPALNPPDFCCAISLQKGNWRDWQRLEPWWTEIWLHHLNACPNKLQDRNMLIMFQCFIILYCICMGFPVTHIWLNIRLCLRLGMLQCIPIPCTIQCCSNEQPTQYDHGSGSKETFYVI